MELKPHNQIAYNNLVQMYKNGIKKAAIVHPTGTGKTYITMKLVQDNPNKKITIVAPTRNIIDQYKRRFEENGIDYSNVTFLTYTKVMNMTEEKLKSLETEQIVLDECHHCGGPEWEKGVRRLIDTNKNANLLGLSATPIRYLDNLRDMTKEFFDGNIASEITLAEAIVDGLLEVPIYHQGLYSIQNEEAKLLKRIEEIPEGEIRDYLSKRLREITESVSLIENTKQILESAITEEKKQGKYIIFCRDIKDMHNAMKHAKEWFSGINDVEMYSVSAKDINGKNIPHAQNQKKIEMFENSKSDKIKLMFAVDMLNEGIHVNGIDGLIMLRGTKSPIVYRQQLGRVLSIGGKEKPLIFDFADNISCTRYIYELYEEAKEIVRKRKEAGKDTKKEEERISKFQIDDHVKKLSELKKELDDYTYMDTSLIEETLRCAKILHENGVDLKHMKFIKNSKRLKLNQLEQDGVDIQKIIRENNLNPLFKIGLGVTVVRLSYNDKSKDYELTENQRKQAEQFGVVKNELDYNKYQKLLYICQILKQNGVKIEDIQTQKSNKKVVLKDIQQEGIDINQLIKELGLESNYPIGRVLTEFRMLYDTFSRKEKKLAKELGILREDKNKIMIQATLQIATILKQHGLDFETLQLDGQTRLKDIFQSNVDIAKIIEENGFEADFKFGKGMDMLIKSYQSSKYKGALSEDDRIKIKEMKLASPPKKKNYIEKGLEVLVVLRKAGVDVSKIKATKKLGKKDNPILLEEIQQDGIDINEIIEQFGLNPKEKIGRIIQNIRGAYAGTNDYKITEEQKRLANDLLKIKKDKTKSEEFLDIAEILSKNGVILHQINKSVSDGQGNRRFILLKEIQQEGIDIEKIIHENNLDGNYNFGYRYNTVVCKYNSGKGLSQGEREKFEKIGAVNLNKTRPMEKFISIVKILHEEGVDFTEIKKVRDGELIQLKDIEQEGIDIDEIIKKYDLDGNYNLGISIGAFRGACKGVNSYEVTDEEIKFAKKIGIVQDEKKDLTEEAFEIIQILIKYGVDFSTFSLRKSVNGSSIPIVLKEIKQEGIDIQRIIAENNLDENYNIGRRIIQIRLAYNGKGDEKELTEEQRELAEKTGILTEYYQGKSLEEFFSTLNILRKHGIDISKVQFGTKKTKFTLKELKIDGVNITELIEKEGLDPEYKIGERVTRFRNEYKKGKLSADRMQEGERIGVFKKPKTMSKVSELICISKILMKYGIDLQKITISTTVNGKQRGLKLDELEYEGVNIAQIIAENNLDPKYPYGGRINYARNAIAGNKGYLITDEEKQEVLKLGLVNRRKAILSEKVASAQNIDEKIEEAKKIEKALDDIKKSSKELPDNPDKDQ